MYLNLKAEMVRKRLKINDLASAINCHRDTMSNKITGETQFTLDEALKIYQDLFPDIDFFYLFKKEPLL